MKFARAWFMLFFLLEGCIDPFPVATVADEPALVVDGSITDQPGPYTVKLFMSTAPAEDPDGSYMVRGASMWIEDDGNRRFALEEARPGVYVSDSLALRGEIGRTYLLRIILRDGTEFQSSEEPLLPPGQIDSLYAEYGENTINQSDPTKPQDAVTFYVNGQSDALNTNGLLRWRSTTVYEINTFPQYRTRMENDIRVPDPIPCSGYIVSHGNLMSVDTCSCCRCWVYEYPKRAVVTPSRVSESNEYRDVAVAEIPVTGDRFFGKFYIGVEQMSVSENVFEFWRRVSAQQQGTGSLFQPNAIKITGNIQCITDPGRDVYGIFSASAITRRSMFVHRNQLPKVVAAPDKLTLDCRYVVENSYNIKPPFW